MADAQEPQGQARQGKQDETKQGKSQQEKSRQDAIAMLTADHRKVEELFSSFEKARTRSQKAKLAQSICNELKVHAKLEEELFYPAVRDETEDDSDLDEAQVEHDTFKILISNLERDDPGGAFFSAKVKVLGEYVKHHVSEEEGTSGIFAQARKAKVDLSALGQQMDQRKQELMEQVQDLHPRLVSLRASGSMGREMSATSVGFQGARGGNGRDDLGRFIGRDNDYDSRSASRDADNRGSRGLSRSGHSMRDEDGGRGRNGRPGDSRGHSAAARRGSDDRGRSMSSRSSRDDDDDFRRGSSSRSARGRDDDDDRGRGGWFGDPRGHSEAARRGWEDRR